MRVAPFFSVVLATYSRGEHIQPTIESVLGQTFSDFELLVVGDGCTDGTQRAVEAFRSPKVSWRNLSQNSGSQSAPNNTGIQNAHGEWIAYVGHDDIWSPNHLLRIREAIEANAGAHFVVSGCIYYGPEGSEIYFVTGLFESEQAPRRHFFPPSSIAHHRAVVEQIGGWRAPRQLRAPVDSDFLLRAFHAGLRFSSTGEVTVHKFAAGHRYLSYLQPSSAEQEAILHQLLLGDTGGTETIVKMAKQRGTFMAMEFRDFPKFQPGSLFERNRKNKGISRPAVSPLTGRAVIGQSDDPRALDWHSLEGRYRWSGPNPRPRILLPLSGGAARISIEVVATAPGGALEDISVAAGGQLLNCVVERSADGPDWIVCHTRLEASGASVLTLHTPTMFRPSDVDGHDQRKLGIAVGDVVVEPTP